MDMGPESEAGCGSSKHQWPVLVPQACGLPLPGNFVQISLHAVISQRQLTRGVAEGQHSRVFLML